MNKEQNLNSYILNKINDVRKIVKEYKKQGLTVGFVPTMGALHDGHASLIKESVAKCDKTIVSVFVNPTQFCPGEDFEKYPRTLEADTKLAVEIGADYVFAPSADEMYQGVNSLKDMDLTYVTPAYRYVDKLCGKSRMGHFDGVALVVTKLFNIVQPDFAFFGMKDAQQLFILKKVVRDLNIDVEIVPCPIVREQSGLALSSRNKYLSENGKQKALCLNKILKNIEELYKNGVVDVKKATDGAFALLPSDAELEYLEFVDYDTFEDVETLKTNTLVALAVRVDGVRLIDNILL
ncbi:pantoate--beta-alanine ligase [bacterium]|nr:pantoate--beta-alanine ligase [bacterium]